MRVAGHDVAVSKNPSTAPATLVGVQLLRGLAAVLVVVSHGNTMMRHPEFFGRSPYPITVAGGFGVNVFFVISGFIIAFVTLDRDGRARIGLRDYARRRFMRIVPFMWVCALGYNLLSFAGTHVVEWGPMLRALTLWPVGELKPNVLWSLRHEWMFYLLFAIAFLGRRRHVWVLAAWFAAPLVYGGAVAWWGAAVRPTDPTLADLLRVVLLGSDHGANLQFATGFVMGLARARGRGWMTSRPGISLVVPLVAILAGAAIVEVLALPSGVAGNIVWTVLPTGIVWLGIVARPAPGAVARVGTWLGDASFSIYLVHNPALLVLYRLGQTVRDVVPLELMHPVFVVVAIGAGIAVHRLVETPLLALLSGRGRLVPWQRRRGDAAEQDGHSAG